jgi:SHS2 domain-containing protein
MMNQSRKDTIDELGNDAGKIIYNMFTTNAKYKRHRLTYMELKYLVDVTYTAIYEQIYSEKYGKVIAEELLEQQKEGQMKTEP